MFLEQVFQAMITFISYPVAIQTNSVSLHEKEEDHRQFFFVTCKYIYDFMLPYSA